MSQYDNMTRLHLPTVQTNSALNGGSHNSKIVIQLDDKVNTFVALKAFYAYRAETCSPLANEC